MSNLKSQFLQGGIGRDAGPSGHCGTLPQLGPIPQAPLGQAQPSWDTGVPKVKTDKG